MSLLYLLSFLDRTAIGNARIAGLATDLGLTSSQYNQTVTVFFVFYGLLEVPSNLCLKRFGAKRWIPFIMTVWGLTMTLTCLVENFGGLLVVGP
jgi:sugar phosphate permease